ncbi:DUF1474 family protein [Mammaliicoccus sp. I-M35]|uniref:type II toxin-antitoxin system toxin TscT n=1 Tax=Mammaliicoccus sp. I-M35 TaxID=2898694 RepID=UPI001EFB8824|nr:DUF1474 family protein [Mammaliicoccus sp. I-M35]
MKHKLFNIENIKFNMDVLQDRMEDLIQSSYWLIEDRFDKYRLESKDEVINHGLGYAEQRIRLCQSVILLQTYKKEMDECIKELDSEINKLKEV